MIRKTASLTGERPILYASAEDGETKQLREYAVQSVVAGKMGERRWATRCELTELPASRVAKPSSK